MDLKMDINQKQILSQHMVQSMEILQMSTQELEAYIENLAVENPMIEFKASHSMQEDTRQIKMQQKLEWLQAADPQNKVYYQQEHVAQNIQENWQYHHERRETLCDYLLSQLVLADYSRKEREMAEYMIYSLDSRGYFNEKVLSVANHFHVSEKTVLQLLKDIQSLEPPGVGARDLKECLCLQIARKEGDFEIVKLVIMDYMDEVAKNHLAEIAKKLHISVHEVQKACQIIRSLNPKPGNSFSNKEQLCYIIPDAVVANIDGQFEIILNSRQYPQFTMNSFYQDMMHHTQDSETKKYLQEKMQQAQWVSNCIVQRTVTLSKIMHMLVEKQHDFFCYGVGYKHPMKLADLAETLNVHVSTISRAMRGKYLQCSFGIFPLNYFLTSVAVRTNDCAEEKTPEQIKSIIQKIVSHEDPKKPYSDQAISEKLKEYQIQISRRTVNKYRMEMGIPDKSGRKMW